MKRTEKLFEERLAKDAQTGSKKAFTYIKRKKVVMKLVRLLNNKSLKGVLGECVSMMAKLAQKSSKRCLPLTAAGGAGDS